MRKLSKKVSAGQKTLFLRPTLPPYLQMLAAHYITLCIKCSLHHIVYKVPITSHHVITHKLSKTELSKIPNAQDGRYNIQFMVGNKKPTLLSKIMSQKDLPSIRKICNLNKNSNKIFDLHWQGSDPV